MAQSTPPKKPIFVFGLRLDGAQETESAKAAVRLLSAELGTWSGPTGNAYAIPFLASDGTVLPLSVIENCVAPFVEFANQSPQRTFQISRFGCGANNHADQEMVKLFSDVPNHCRLPGVWSGFSNSDQAARLLIFDSSAQNDQTKWREQLAQYLSFNAPLWDGSGVEVVSVGTARAIVTNDKIARA